MMAKTERLPVSVVGGFLGAGKTSLLNRLLQETGGRRLGLIVNDFGDINIDEQLIVARDETMITLANGCICCSIGNDFLRALVALVTRPDPPDQIVIEASGVANPARIASIARADRSLHLQGVTVLVDAVNFCQQLGDPLLKDTLEGQVRAADLVILTKVDIASDEEVIKARDAVRNISPDVRMIASPVEALPVDLVFDLGDPHQTSDAPLAEPHHPFWSGTFASDQPCDVDVLRQMLGSLPPNLLRLKGVVSDSEGHGFAVQWVAGRLVIDPHALADPSARSTLVYIGVGEEEASIKDLLATSFV
ncbi:MAG: cobalamin biosynthesis protein CobW [Rhodobiaceae bacterium]|nr:MAG: cobalamin biosynthesis protein CobW [Rhodobiaceae bacterium]